MSMRYISVFLVEVMIVKFPILLYNNQMIKKLTLTAALALLVAPMSALAYLNPDEVLLSRELFLPPSAREGQMRTTVQSGESAARREREQERAFELQNPIVEEPVFASTPQEPQQYGLPAGGYYVVPTGGAPAAGLGDSANLELLRTMRLLSRINQNQATAQLQNVLHSFADDLAPTGAGSIVAALVMVGCVFFVLRRAKKSETQVQTF